VLVPALLSGCLPLIVIFIAALALPTAIVAAAAWLLGLSDVQQVAAAVIVVGAEMVLFPSPSFLSSHSRHSSAS
jgi:hypothetical protein